MCLLSYQDESNAVNAEDLEFNPKLSPSAWKSTGRRCPEGVTHLELCLHRGESNLGLNSTLYSIVEPFVLYNVVESRTSGLRMKG